VSEDHERLARWRAGDREAGSALLRRHFPTLTRFFRSKAPESAVSDLIQRTMLGAVESRDRVPENLPFRVYLLGIARRCLADFYRKSDRSVRGRDMVLRREVDPSIESPSRAMATTQEQRILLAALRRLDLDLQIIVELFYWEELNTEEIAAVLDIPRGTVKSRLRRARIALEKEIETIAETPELFQTTVNKLEHWAAGLRDQLGGPFPENENG
jgi:RNA polymerase sigma-70 factor (ECF subfamily)